ncbi:hypothetical protein JCM10212_005718 [Sporobolomyces blumeae]
MPLPMSTEQQPSKGSQLLASGKELFSKLPKDFNALRQQTTPLLYRQGETLQLQLYIKSVRNVGTDLAALARDSSVASKNLFLWAKDDPGADIVDIFDRAAFLQFKTSEIEQAAAAKVEEARVLLKDIRNFENDLSNRRKNRANLDTKLQKERDKHSKGKNTEQIHELSTELAQADAEIKTFEESFEALKRQKLHESFSIQMQAQKELGEKLAIVAGYGELLIQGMETDGISNDYHGKDRTASIKADLEESLLSWQPSSVPTLSNRGSSLQHSDTRSFGATHADQLSQLGDDDAQSHGAPSHAITHGQSLHPSHSAPLHFVPPLPSIPATPGDPAAESAHRRPVPPIPVHQSPFEHSSSSSSFHTAEPGRSPSSHGLNLSPTPQDLGAGFSPPPHATGGFPVPQPPAGVSPPQPTVAETGAPKLGTGGPSSGTLRPRSSSVSQGGQASPSSHLGGASAPAAPAAVENLEPLPPAATSTSSTSPSGMPGSLPMDDAGWGEGGGASSVATGERLPGYGEGDDEARRAHDEAERILASEREQKRTV